jgi:ABC-type dipeptide/oligopeptide/nickel transport system permease component
VTRNLPAMVLRRLAVLPLQVFGVSVVTFFVIRLLPGNPAELILGYERTEETVAALTRQLGLDKPILTQYRLYLERLFRGDLGHSYFTGEAVATDLIRRVPATLELITYSLVLAMLVGLALGIASAGRRRGVLALINNIYGRAAGAFPDFWIGLIAVYVFFFVLRWAPPPLGRLGISVVPPPRVTGFYTIDSLIAGDFATLANAVAHLALPVLVLGLVTAPLIAKITNSVLADVLRTDYVRYARACGLPRGTIYRYAVRNALPPVLTVFGTLFVYLLGGAVLMEKVFAWGGVGLYSVQAVTQFDYLALQGFVLVASIFTMIVYLVVDILVMWLDPRIKA